MLEQGGMMSLERAVLFGKSMLLLRPLKADAEGNITIDYSYFDDKAIDNAGFSANTLEPASDVDMQQFSRVCRAVQILTALYASDPVDSRNGELAENKYTIGWLNCLFDEQYAGDDMVEKILTTQYLGCTDDDRAHFWTVANEAAFSSALQEQLHSWDMTLNRLENGKMPFTDGTQFAEALVETLADLANYNPSLMMFQNTFYDFLANWPEHRTQAAYQLLHGMMKQLKSTRETCDDRAAEQTATQIRRYFAVLSNYGLRDRALGL